MGQRLTELLRRNVPVTGDALGLGTEDALKRMRPGEILMLENLRFHAEEEANDPAFAATLASYAEIYVNDAFGSAHRAHASTVGIAKLLPAYAGLLMERELEMLSKLLEAPERPFAAILGGAKVSDKIKVIDHLLTKVDMLVLGGGMANTFLLAQGKAIGKSLAEPDRVQDAQRILATAEKNGVRVVLPVDVIVAKEVTRGTEYKTLQAEKIPASWHIVDLGKASQDLMVEALGRREDRVLERPTGRVRDPVVRAWHERRRAAARGSGGTWGHGRDRRRRLGGVDHAAGSGRPHDPHLDRWWRIAGVPRRARAAGGHGAAGSARAPEAGEEGCGQARAAKKPAAAKLAAQGLPPACRGGGPQGVGREADPEGLGGEAAAKAAATKPAAKALAGKPPAAKAATKPAGAKPAAAKAAVAKAPPRSHRSAAAEARRQDRGEGSPPSPRPGRLPRSPRPKPAAKPARPRPPRQGPPARPRAKTPRPRPSRPNRQATKTSKTTAAKPAASKAASRPDPVPGRRRERDHDRLHRRPRDPRLAWQPHRRGRCRPRRWLGRASGGSQRRVDRRPRSRRTA